jgi:hypothetical protein
MNLNQNVDIRSSVKTLATTTLLVAIVIFLSGCSGPMIDALQAINSINSMSKL